jgi:hypothetical protein
MFAPGRWTIDEIADRIDGEIGFEEMPFLADIERRRLAALQGERGNA